MADRALVRNAADPKQRDRADRVDRERTRLYHDALRASLCHPECRYVFSELLERAGLDRGGFEHSGSQLYFNEGRRTFGLEFREALIAADARLFEQMVRERRERQEREDRATDAHHTARAEEAMP